VTWSLVDRLADTARQAGRAILEAGHRELDVAHKADESPVTQADRASHQVIIAGLFASGEDAPIVSEEGTIPAYEIRRHWTRFWLVDPLDGTKEFLAGSGEYTVNIALIEGVEPILGIVYAPATDLMYVAGRNLGSWKQQGTAARERLYSSPPPPQAALVIAESRSHPSPQLEAYLRTIPVKARLRAGSSLKFCWVAEGKADLYPRFGPTMEWDTAAGDCVYRQSGRDGERRSPLRYNTPLLRHERFVIGAD